MEREKGLKRHKKTTGNKKRKQETKDNERRGKDRECKSKAEEPGNRGKDHVKYTIPKETLHFLRFPKLMYYHMGVHPPSNTKVKSRGSSMFPQIKIINQQGGSHGNISGLGRPGHFRPCLLLVSLRPMR